LESFSFRQISAPPGKLKKPPSRRDILPPQSPDVDVRETDSEYIFDIEVPGITDKKSITIEWVNSRLLVVDGETPRPPLSVAGSEDTKESEDQKTQKGVPRLRLAERRLGRWQRDFYFPVDVDAKGLRATGLLRISVPKKDDGPKLRLRSTEKREKLE
jgi:HSP20 family molecular chaperone IbpA